jgi:uncharacterized protein (UPF0332 family)
MAVRGRRKYEPDKRKFIELLGTDQYQLLRDVLARPEVASDLPGSWLHVQRERLRLAEQHLAVAEELNKGGVSGEIRPEKRSVVSRAYYAMFCAARAALSYHFNGDHDGHTAVPKALAKSPLGKQAERDRVVGSLNAFRAARNEADYSPFYPRPLGQDARRAIQEARYVVKIARKWIDGTARARAPKKARSRKAKNKGVGS